MIPYEDFSLYHHESNLINLIDKNYNFICSKLNLDKPINDLADSIAYYYKSLFQRKIYFTLQDEPFNVSYFNIVNQVAELLIKNHDIKIDQLVLVTGLHPCERNMSLYKTYCKEHNWLPIPLYYTNHLEYEARRDALKKENLMAQIITEPRIKSKKFLCYNRITRVHRLCILGEFFRRNLINDGYISFWSADIESDIESMDTEDNDIATFHRTKQLILDNKHLFPMFLSIVGDPNHNVHQIHEGDEKPNYFLTNREDIDFYNDSYFSIVTETNFFNKVNIHGAPAIGFSEKTFKPIQAKHPFILVNAPYSLHHLKDLGYKTFHPIIDESYDLIEDDEARLLAAMDEVERLCLLADEEWLKMQIKLQEIVEFNYKLLMNKINREMYDQFGKLVTTDHASSKNFMIKKNSIWQKNGYELDWIK